MSTVQYQIWYQNIRHGNPPWMKHWYSRLRFMWWGHDGRMKTLGFLTLVPSRPCSGVFLWCPPIRSSPLPLRVTVCYASLFYTYSGTFVWSSWGPVKINKHKPLNEFSPTSNSDPPPFPPPHTTPHPTSVDYFFSSHHTNYGIYHERRRNTWLDLKILNKGTINVL